MRPDANAAPASRIVVEDLKRRIAKLESGVSPASGMAAEDGRNSLSFGLPELDAALPGGGLALGALHELGAAGYRERAAALGIALALTGRLLRARSGPLLWCDPPQAPGEGLPPYAPGLTALGCDPDRLIWLRATSEQDLLWALEEGVSCPQLAGVVGVLWSEKLYDFTASRRLSLRAAKSGVPLLLLRGHQAGAGRSGSSAAATRWSVGTLPSIEEDSAETQSVGVGGERRRMRGAGFPAWRLELTRCRGGRPGQWDVYWNHETLCFGMAAALAGRTAAAPHGIDRPATGELATERSRRRA